MEHGDGNLAREVFATLAVIVTTGIVGRAARLSHVSILVIAGMVLSTLTSMHLGPFPASSTYLVPLAHGGVLVLLHCHGLSSSLDKLRKSWRIIVVGGGLQILLAILFGLLTAWLIVPDCTWSKALFVGILMSTASSAVVYSDLKKRDKENTPEGFFANQCLIGHDLSLLPFAILVPAIAAHGNGVGETVGKISIGVLITAVVFALEWVIVCRVIDWAGKALERELFYLTVGLIVSGTVYACELAQLSAPFGMFLGGILIARTRYRDSIRALAVPLRDLALPFFYVSVGLLTSWDVLQEHWFRLIISAFGLLLVKFIAVTLSALIVGLNLPAAVRSGGLLAHLGESSFVIGLAGLHLNLLTPQDAKVFILLAAISVAVTPLLNRWLDKKAEKLPDFGLRHLGASTIWSKEVKHHEEHIVIVGYGRVGKKVAELVKSTLRRTRVVIDINAERCLEAAREGHDFVTGDAALSHILKQAAASFANAIIVTDAKPEVVRCIIGILQHLQNPPKLYVRTTDLDDAEEIEDAAKEVYKNVTVVCDETAVISPLQELLISAFGVKDSEVAKG